jgi:transposase InsO family protein
VGIDTQSSSDLDICEGSAYGKAHRLPFGKRPRATTVGEIVLADLCGPSEESFSGLKYFVRFTDEFTQYRSVYFMKQKSETVLKLRNYLAETRTRGIVVQELRCDNGGKFTSNEFRTELAKYGIKFSPSEPFTPQQNGSAEQENRTIVECARSLRLAHVLFSKRLKAELTSTAVYLLNRTGPSGVDGKPPYELWCGKKT